MMEKHCFAYRNGKCKALKVKKCEGDSCPFFKTKAQADEDQKKVFRRINSLILRPEEISWSFTTEEDESIR